MKFTNPITSLHLHLFGLLASRRAPDVTVHLQFLFRPLPLLIVTRTRSELTLLVAKPLLVVQKSVAVRQLMTALP